MKVTIKDVAKEANVATSTVSRVLSNSPKISEKTKEIRIRFQYNYNADEEKSNNSFIGVGYIFLDELLNGFRDNEK